MKLKYSFFLVTLLLVFIFGWMSQVSAQTGDTLLVSWETTPGSGIPLTNALYNAVMGDTNASGARLDLNRVYLLQKGGVYWNTEHFQNNGYALRFVGQSPDPTDIYGNPPTLQMVARGDGSVDGHIILGYGDVYMKNIYVIESDNNGVQTYYQPIEFEANNLHVAFDSCIFERSNFAVAAWNGKNNEISFTNCIFRNLVERPITQQWTGRGISIWADEDSVIVENCTFYNVGFTAIQIEGGAANYVRFDHNTLVNIGRGINTTTWLRTAYFVNNLYINTFFDGEGYNDYSLTLNPSRDPRAYTSGMFSFAGLPSSYGPDLGRRIAFSNSAAFLAQSFRNAWADTVRVQPYINAVIDSFFTTYSPANGGQMVIQDTSWLTSVPKFANFDTTNYPKMISFIQDVRAGISPAPWWVYNMQTDPSTGDTLWTAPSWPIKENFTYTDQTLMTAGTDGLPLGDLNWFPTQLKLWEANKAANIAKIENIPGGKRVFTVDTTAEAESGTVGGSAAVAAVQGLTYYDYTGAGSLTWTFNVTTPGQYDTRWLVNETGRGQSGPVLAINGATFVDKAHGWGQFVFDPLLGPAIGQPNNAWIWVPITADSVLTTQASLFTLAAGSNTIGVTGGGWGEVQFAEIDVVLHGGTDALKLKAPNAVPVLVKAGAVGVKWVASGFKYVNMGTSGTDQFTINVPADGIYRLSMSYQNAAGPANGSVKVDGATVLSSLDFTSNTDSTALTLLTNSFNLTQGTHTFIVGSGNVNLDYVQLVSEMVTGIKNVQNQPSSYALQQNYPNPFNPSTIIEFSLAKGSHVELQIFNILGQKVATLVNGFMNAGAHSVQFNASNLASGVYFYGMKAGDFQTYKKMMLLK